MQEIEELAGIAGKKLNDVHLTKYLDEELSSETSHEGLLNKVQEFLFGKDRICN